LCVTEKGKPSEFVDCARATGDVYLGPDFGPAVSKKLGEFFLIAWSR